MSTNSLTASALERSASRDLCALGSLSRRVPATLLLAPVLVAASLAAAHADPCLPVSQPLLKIPELVSKNGVLRGTVVLTDEQRRLIFRSPGKTPGQPGSFFDCQPQRVRAFLGLEAVPKVRPSPGGIIDPFPGPTLRARVGDIIQLAFINQIDPNRFPYSIDQGEKRGISGVASNPASGCDVSNPGNPQAGYPLMGADAFPDCFHGSSTGNIHFHGTHTNPNGTADNVLLEIRPSPRDPASRAPLIKPETFKKQFADFFKACEAQLRGDVFSAYPQTWNDAPLGPYTTAGTWTNQQMKLLQDYDAKTKESLWAANKKVIDQDLWPQYYIGAYPYCFQLPQYTQGNWPPPPGGLQMGQSPGTHWYHAHKHGSTAINVSNGMTGVFIIEGPYDDALNAFYGPGWTRQQPVMVINQLGVSPNLFRTPASQGGPGAGSQDKGPDFTVNGRFQPTVDMVPGEVKMWRIANTSGRSGAFFGGFAPGLQWMQLAQDGVQLADENYQASKNKSLLLASGNRADLLVKAPMTPGIYPVLVQHAVDPTDLPSANPVVLVQVNVRGNVPPARGNRAEFIKTAPPQPPFLKNITDAEVASTINNPRVIKFASSPPNFPVPAPGTQRSYAMHTINGQKFDDGKDTAIPVTLNVVEEWRIENWTFGPLISHPFHIHINPFQIVGVFSPNQTVVNANGATVPKYVFYNNPAPDPAQCYLDPNDPSSWKDCKAVNDPSKPQIWWDVFSIPSGIGATDAQGNPIKGANGQQIMVPGYFRMRSRFVDYAGQYVLHCHILAHEDRGMMVLVQVSAPGKKIDPTVYRHH